MKSDDKPVVQYLAIKDGKLTVHESLGYADYAYAPGDIENGQAVFDESDYVLVFTSHSTSHGDGIAVDLVEGEVPGREAQSMILGWPKYLGM